MFILLILPLYYLIFWNSKDKTLFYLGVFVLFFLSAFRATTVGVDTLSYMFNYKSAGFYNLKENWISYFTQEPIYCSIEYYCHKWGCSYRFMMWIQSFLFLFPIVFGLSKISIKTPIASLALLILLGYFFCSLNITRQLIALSFCFLGYCLLDNRKFLWCIFSFLIAIGFHSSALIVILVLVLPFIRLNRFVWAGILLTSFIVPLVVDLSTYIVLFVEQISSFESFLFYIQEEFTALDRLPIYSTIRTGMFIFALFNYKPQDDKPDLFFNLALFAVVVHNLLYGVPSWAGRIVYYFDIAFIVFLVRWSSKNTIATILTLVYSLLFYFHHYIIQHQEGIYPFVLNL